MRHARMPCASLSRCGKVVSSSSASDWKYPLSCSMLLSGTFLPLSTPPLCLLLFFSPRSFLPYTFFALTLERYSFIPTIVCLVLSRCATRGKGRTRHRCWHLQPANLHSANQPPHANSDSGSCTCRNRSLDFLPRAGLGVLSPTTCICIPRACANM
jgi:hypothetical protein